MKRQWWALGMVLTAGLVLSGCSTEATSAAAPAAASSDVVQLSVQATDACCATLTKQAMAQVLGQMPGVVQAAPVTNTLYKITYNPQKTTLTQLENNILTSTGYQAAQNG